jgi:predicted helicase
MGDYTEMTFRTPFQNFIENISSDYFLFQEPGRVKNFGAPDFKVFRKKFGVGYIETKTLKVDLYEELASEQMSRYKENIGNFLFTNYHKFILVREGLEVKEVDLFRLPSEPRKIDIDDDRALPEFLDMLGTFFSYSISRVNDARELAIQLSKKAKLIRDIAEELLVYDIKDAEREEKEKSPIYEFYIGIRELIHDIDTKKCADAYGQTVTYGLFLSKMNLKQSLLKREEAAMNIPKSIPVIRKIFQNISNETFPSSLGWIVEDIIDILNVTDIEKITKEFNERGKKDRDPITFFYESFLGNYDKESQKHLGVYYTPRPVVNFIVNSVQQLLKSSLTISLGLADDNVTLLDPATGTGTFMWMAYLVALKELENKKMLGVKNEKIEKHLLSHFYGLEILIAPYIFAHLKLSSGLKSIGYEMKDTERIQVYYSNTLDINEKEKGTLLPFLRELTEESRIANSIKSNKKILTIIGNPPYNRLSSNKSEWILEKMNDYKEGLVKDEKNKQPLDDDYLKFFRFAQWKIEQNGMGILGFITNNSYLDGIMHREMRKKLYSTFDQIYIINLHGDSRKGETASDGVKDENVFDIQQGVSIGIFLKSSNKSARKAFKYYDKYGLREDKYYWLDRTTVFNVPWVDLEPSPPYFYMKPIDNNSEYNNFYPLQSIFKEINTTVVPGNNEILVDKNEEKLRKRMQTILVEKDVSKYREILTNSAGKKILKGMGKADFASEKLVKFHFHPFDFRYIYFEPSIMERARDNHTKNLRNDNFGLVLSRVNARDTYDSAIVTKEYPYYKLAESSRGSYLIPLYLYGKKSCGDESVPCLNVQDSFLDFLKSKYGDIEISGVEIMGYIYALLYSRKFRKTFNDQLKEDFPKIPFPSDKKEFEILANLGNELINLHLLNSDIKSQVEFNVQGSNRIESVSFSEDKIYINQKQFFGGVPEDDYEFVIGGYQILKKWLNERKGDTLSGKDIEHFMHVAGLLAKTREVMDEIDGNLAEMF